MNKTELLAALNKRYAVKKFNHDASKDVSEIESLVKDILQLTPTSFGLQAQKFLIIKDNDIRKQLRQYSWGQQQITDSHMLVVFCIPTNFDRSYIERATMIAQHIRGMDDKSTSKRIDFMEDKIIHSGKEIGIVDIDQWLTHQLYIALGNILTSLALLDIDSCPIEGFQPDKYDEILNLQQKNLQAKVVLAIGDKSSQDTYQHVAKVRFSKDELFEEY